MMTKLERAEQNLRKEQHASDLRRLRKAYKTLTDVVSSLTVPFYEESSNLIAERLIASLRPSMAQIETVCHIEPLLEKKD